MFSIRFQIVAEIKTNSNFFGMFARCSV